MNLKSSFTVLALLAVIHTLAAEPLGRAITYQGKLQDGGSPANGHYDFRFWLATAPTSGTLLAVVTNEMVAVSNGLFTSELDFGKAIFTDEARWLDLGVRVSGDTNNFTRLSPRQPLTPVPFALNAARAAEADAVPWSGLTGLPTGGGLNLSGTNVGVNFGGSGTNQSVAHSDHGHFGAIWNGASSSNGLSVLNTHADGIGFYGRQGSGSGMQFLLGSTVGVLGDSSNGIGVFGASLNGRGVNAAVIAPTGTNYGVYSSTRSSEGRGVYGLASADSGQNFGVVGETDSTDGRGVHGYAKATTGYAYGVSGYTDSTSGRAVFGRAAAGSGLTAGVFGYAVSPAGVGVQGFVTANTGTNYGVKGTSDSPDGAGGYFANNREGTSLVVTGDGDGPLKPTLHVGNTHSTAGVAARFTNDSAHHTVRLANGGSGSVLSLFNGRVGNVSGGDFIAAQNGDGAAAFKVKEKGSVEQALGANGLVKAAALIRLSETEGETTRVIRYFNNVNGLNFSVSRDGEGHCLVDFKFNVDSRFFVVSAASSHTHVEAPLGWVYYNPLDACLVSTSGNTARFMVSEESDPLDHGTGDFYVLVY